MASRCSAFVARAFMPASCSDVIPAKGRNGAIAANTTPVIGERSSFSPAASHFSTCSGVFRLLPQQARQHVIPAREIGDQRRGLGWIFTTASRMSPRAVTIAGGAAVWREAAKGRAELRYLAPEPGRAISKHHYFAVRCHVTPQWHDRC